MPIASARFAAATKASRSRSIPAWSSAIGAWVPGVKGRAEGATVWKQAVGLAGAIAWSAAGTFVVLMICKFTTGLRVARDEEVEGLDYTQHGEAIH